MAYIIDDDENRIQNIKEKIDELEIQTFSPEVVGRNESTRNTGIETGDSATLNPYPEWIPIRDYGTLGNLTLQILLTRVDGHAAKMTLNGDTNFAFSEPPGTNKMMSFVLDVTIDAIGGYTINLPASVEPASVVIDNAANARTVLRLQTTDGGVTYQAINLSTGGGGGLSEPVILTINTITPQTLPTKSTIDWSKNPNQITIDRDVEFDFSNLPASGSYEGVLVIIDIDGTGGYAAPVWPGAVTNPPVVPTTANTRTSVMLYTIDGGTTVTHATSVGSGTSGASQWSTFPALQDINYATFDGINIDRLLFDQAAGSSLVGTTTGITSNATSDLLHNVPASSFHRFSSNLVDIVEFDDTTGLKMLGTHNINMNKNIINIIGKLEFDNTLSVAPVSVSIDFNTTLNALVYNVPITTDTHQFKANAELLATFSRIAANEGQLTIEAVVANLLTANELLDFATFTNSSPLNGNIWLDLTSGQLKGRENGATFNLNSTIGSQTPWLQDIDADGFDLKDLSNIEFRSTTGAPAGTVPAIWWDTSDMIFNVPTADDFQFKVNGANAILLGSVGIFPATDGNLNLGSTSLSWDRVVTETVRFELGGPVATSANRIQADSGGMVYMALSTGSHGFYMNGAERIQLQEDGTIHWVQSGRQHDIIPQTTSLDIVTELTTDSLKLITGGSRTNETVKVETLKTTFFTENNNTAAYALQLVQNHDTPAAFRTLANIDIIAENTSSVDTIYARISASSQVITASSEDGLLQLGIVSGGTLIAAIDMEGSGSAGVNDAKIGFFGETPVVQQSVASDTLANLYTALRNLGLIV